MPTSDKTRSFLRGVGALVDLIPTGDRVARAKARYAARMPDTPRPNILLGCGVTAGTVAGTLTTSLVVAYIWGLSRKFSSGEAGRQKPDGNESE